MTNTWIITTTPAIGSLVAAARDIGGPLTVVSVGENFSVSDVDRVICLPTDAGVPAEALAPAVARMIDAGPHDAILAPNRAAERVFAGAVAARLHAPVLTGVTGFAAGTITRSRFGGIAIETVRPSGPVVIIMDGGAALTGQPAAPERQPVDGTHPAHVVGEHVTEVPQVDLGAAKRVVAVGRGFRAKEDLQLAQDLARTLGAQIGCSRPLAEGQDWLPKNTYIGISGQTVKPDLYIAVGISGQLQHTVGAADAKTVVVIDKDPDAPYFKQADFGIIGDLYEVLPTLTSALRDNAHG